MSLSEMAPDAMHIPLDPLSATNAYLLGDTLVDAGGRYDAAKIRKSVAGRAVTLHVVTHVHPDHQGSSKAITDELKIPFAAPRQETEQARSGDFEGLLPDTRRARAAVRLFAGPGVEIEQELKEGDAIGGDFTVVGLPGHSPGQVGFWRQSDRVFVVGDAFRNISFATGRSRPALPPDFFTCDAAQARHSVEKIRDMQPRILAFGHGRPLVGEAEISDAIGVALSRG